MPSTNPVECMKGEIRRRTDVVHLPLCDEAILRLVGALPRERHDARAVQRARCGTLETIGAMRDDPLIRLPPAAS